MKKRDESQTDEVKRLDDEIETEQSKANKLTDELEGRRKECERLNTRCTEIAYQARANDDINAIIELKDLRESLKGSDDEITDLQVAVAESVRRLEKLRAQKADGCRDTMRAECLLKLQELAQIGGHIDLALYDALTGVAELGQCAREADRLAREAGLELHGGPYRNFVEHVYTLARRLIEDEVKENFHQSAGYLRKAAKRAGDPMSLESIFKAFLEGVRRKEQPKAA